MKASPPLTTPRRDRYNKTLLYLNLDRAQGLEGALIEEPQKVLRVGRPMQPGRLEEADSVDQARGEQKTEIPEGLREKIGQSQPLEKG